MVLVSVIVVTDLYSGGCPHNAEKTRCEYILTELTKSNITSCNSLLLLYIITITKITYFYKFAYKFSKNSCE